MGFFVSLFFGGGCLGGLRKGENGRGCEEPRRWEAMKALRQTASEKFPVARRPKNVRTVNV